MFLSKFIIISILTVNGFASNWYSTWKSEYHSKCTESQSCIDQPIVNSSLFKAVNAKFEKCPDTRFCYEPESQIRILDTSRLFLQYGSRLKISGNSTLEMNGDSFFRITERSDVSNEGSISTYSADIDLLSNSELKNEAEIILKNKSSVIVNEQSKLHVRKNSKIWLASKSVLKIEEHSWLIMESEYFQNEEEKRELHLMNKSKLEISSGSSLVHSGKIFMNEGSSWKIMKGGNAKLDCFFQISRDSNVTVEGGLRIGTITREYGDHKNGSTSLVFAKSGISLIVKEPNDLWITTGAHCLLKQSFVAGSWKDKILPETKNEYFDCYASRAELSKAIVLWNITAPLDI